MLDLLEGYLENIAAAATQTAANGGPVAELAASLAVYMDMVARQQLEIKQLTEKPAEKEGRSSYQWSYRNRREQLSSLQVLQSG